MIFLAIGLVAFVFLWFAWEFLVWRSQGLGSVRPGAAAGGQRNATLEDLFEAQDAGWLRIDDNVVQAVAQLTHGTIDSGLDLWTAFADEESYHLTDYHGDRLRMAAIEEELVAVSQDLGLQLESAVARAAAALSDAQLALQTQAAAALRYSLVRVAARRGPPAFVAARRRRIWISQASRALAQDDALATLDVLCAHVRHDDPLASIAKWSRARARALAELSEAGLRIEQEVRSTRTAAFLCLNADRQRVKAWVSANHPRIAEPSL
jgi:hypothetical protein